MGEKRKGRITAAEHMAQLRSDPEWVRQQEKRDAHFRDVEARFKAEENPLTTDLAEAGVRVLPSLASRLESGDMNSQDRIVPHSVWDLVNSKESYSAAIPILLKHLRRPYHPVIRDGIARALTVPETRGATAREILETLKREEKKEQTDGLPRGDVRWALANALTIVGDESMAEEIKSLIADSNYADVYNRLTDALKHCERLAKHRSGRRGG